jgi:hypothetical protein
MSTVPVTVIFYNRTPKDEFNFALLEDNTLGYLRNFIQTHIEGSRAIDKAWVAFESQDRQPIHFSHTATDSDALLLKDLLYSDKPNSYVSVAVLRYSMPTGGEQEERPMRGTKRTRDERQ